MILFPLLVLVHPKTLQKSLTQTNKNLNYAENLCSLVIVPTSRSVSLLMVPTSSRKTMQLIKNTKLRNVEHILKMGFVVLGKDAISCIITKSNQKRGKSSNKLLRIAAKYFMEGEMPPVYILWKEDDNKFIFNIADFSRFSKL